MNTISHIVIADKLSKDIEDILGISMKKYSFLYGSVRPDLRRNKFHTTHYKEDATIYVYNMIRYVLEEYEDVWDTKEFYLRLGEIIHFITDFFTFAHNKSYFDGSRKDHHIYEFKQILLLSKQSQRRYLEEIDKEIPELCNLNQIVRYIEELHKEYIDAGPCKLTDCIFAYKACRAITGAILLVHMNSENTAELHKNLVLAYEAN